MDGSFGYVGLNSMPSQTQDCILGYFLVSECKSNSTRDDYFQQNAEAKCVSFANAAENLEGVKLQSISGSLRISR